MQNLNAIKKKKVLVIGETIIDKYVTTEAIGKSGKEAMLVLKPKLDLVDIQNLSTKHGFE